MGAKTTLIIFKNEKLLTVIIMSNRIATALGRTVIMNLY
jgi:hypothetical protein